MTEESSKTSSTTPGENEPIDAEFEPAPKTLKETAEKTNVPSWSGVAAASIAAALAGGAIGTISTGSDGQYASATEVAVDIEKLRSREGELSDRITRLRSDVSEIQIRIESEIQRLDTASQTQVTQVEDVETSVAAVTARLEALLGPMSVSIQSESDDSSEGGGNNSPSAGAAEADGTLSLVSLASRLAAIEALASTGDNRLSEELQEAVGDLRTRIVSLETTTADTSQALETRAETLADLKVRVDDIERQLDDGVAQGVNTSAETDSRIETLRDELAALQSQISSASISAPTQTPSSSSSRVELDTNTRADAALALSSIEAASRKGREFASSYRRLASALPNNADVQALARISNKPVPTLSQLQNRYADLLPAIREDLIDANPNAANQGWFAQIMAGFVKVRPHQGEGSSNALAILLSAEDALSGGDLETATEKLRDLEGPAQSAMADWLRDAESRIALEARLDAIRLRLIGLEQ